MYDIQGLADSQRVGMYGWSYGGYLSLMALAKAANVFTCAVAGAPVSSWDGYGIENYISYIVSWLYVCMYTIELLLITALYHYPCGTNHRYMLHGTVYGAPARECCWVH